MIRAVLMKERESFSLSFRAYIPLALLYGYTLALSWRPDLLRTLLPGSLSAGFQGMWNDGGEVQNRKQGAAASVGSGGTAEPMPLTCPTLCRWMESPVLPSTRGHHGHLLPP